MGEYYAGNLKKRDIRQAEWFLLLQAVPVTGLNVEQLVEMRKHRPLHYKYWLTRAIEKENLEAKAARMIPKAQARNQSSSQ